MDLKTIVKNLEEGGIPLSSENFVYERSFEVLSKAIYYCDMSFDFDINSIETSSWDNWVELSVYVKNLWCGQWYNVIIENDAEEIQRESLEELAKILLDYQTTAKQMILHFNPN